jgi:hypothetical protein
MQGGVGDFTREIGLALNGLGATVSAVSSIRASQSSTAPRSSHDGVPIRRNGLHLTLFPVVERWGFSSWSQVTEVLRHTSSEILNVQYQTAAYQMHPAVNFLPWRLRLLRDRPGIVTTFHDLKLPYLFPKAGAVRRWVTSALISGSDATIVTNVRKRRRVMIGRSGVIDGACARKRPCFATSAFSTKARGGKRCSDLWPD